MRTTDGPGTGVGESGTAPAAVELAHRIFDFARAGDTGRIGTYVDAGVPVELTDAAGNTLLMLAAYHGHPDTVRALLVRGAHPDTVNDRGQSPLAGAVFKGEEQVISALVAGGADPGLGRPSALETARFFGRTDLLALLESGDGGSGVADHGSG